MCVRCISLMISDAEHFSMSLYNVFLIVAKMKNLEIAQLQIPGLFWQTKRSGKAGYLFPQSN